MSTGKPPLPLQRPPGYRDPDKPPRRPPAHRAIRLPPSLQPAKRRRGSCCRICCCCFCVILIILILVLISAVLTFYLWFEPRLPEFHFESIKFTKFNVSTTADGPVLDTESTVVVEVKNPNQDLGIVYGKTDVLLSGVNGDACLGEQTVAGFTQGKGNVRTLKLKMKVERMILDSRSAEQLKKGFKSKSLLLNAEIRSAIGIKHGRWATAPVAVEVFCDGMRLSQLQTGGSIRKCRIKLFNLIFIK